MTCKNTRTLCVAAFCLSAATTAYAAPPSRVELIDALLVSELSEALCNFRLPGPKAIAEIYARRWGVDVLDLETQREAAKRLSFFLPKLTAKAKADPSWQAEMCAKYEQIRREEEAIMKGLRGAP